MENEQEQAQFPKLEKGHEQKSIKDLDFLLDVPLEISVELGRTKLLVNDLLHLGQGSVVELTKLAGEPLEDSDKP